MLEPAFADRVSSSPGPFPVELDLAADLVRLLYLSEEDYCSASFLDARLINPGSRVEWRPWEEVSEAASGLKARCHFIFHISHVGSTLLSRLLGQHKCLFSLREPSMLRTITEIHWLLGDRRCVWNRADFDKRLFVFLALWSRTFRPDQVAVIKASSVVSEMSSRLLQMVAAARAVFVTVPPHTFLQSLLGGKISDIASRSAARSLRLQRRLGDAQWQVASLSPGETVAMSWLCEVLALREAASQAPDRAIWLDFDRFLDEPRRTLLSVFQHLGVDAEDETVDDVLAGPTMRRHSKSPERYFDAQMRSELLKRAEREHSVEIRKGLAWLEHLAAAQPLVADALVANG